MLTTQDFADRLLAMRELGLEVEVLEEDALAQLGMRALLAVGQGSDSPSKVVVMQWRGGGDAPPLALVGKGVTFDTGGYSLKTSDGMKGMNSDMGGAAAVIGAMSLLRDLEARVKVTGYLPLVENMIGSTVLRRLGQPDEVAAVITFLASDDASYVTGQSLGASGGLARL